MSAAPTGTGSSPATGRMPPHHHRLGPLIDVNVLGLQWLVASAKKQESEKSGFLKTHGDALVSLTDARLNRLASRLSLLLFDLHFHDAAWWTAQVLRGSFSQQASVDDPGTGLARSMLVLAWHTARADRDAALVMLGLSPSVADVISQMHLQDVDRIAARHHQAVTPRWPNNERVWVSILATGTGKSTPTSQSLALQCLSLAAGDVLQTQ